MSLYTPRTFVPTDATVVDRLLTEHPFAVLITPANPEPSISHLPLQYRAEGSHGLLLGHMARANPHWQRFGQVASVAIFRGPHAYVSPSWYAEPVTAVPTWNYAVAHVHGRVELLPDSAETRKLLDEMIERYESTRPAPWRLQLQGRALTAMVDAIVGFRMVIERVDAKLKLSQNRSAVDRERVIEALRAEGYAEAQITAEWMERYAREGS